MIFSSKTGPPDQLDFLENRGKPAIIPSDQFLPLFVLLWEETFFESTQIVNDGSPHSAAFGWLLLIGSSVWKHWKTLNRFACFVGPLSSTYFSGSPPTGSFVWWDLGQIPLGGDSFGL